MTVVDDNDNDDYPEGGIQAWTVVLGAWCAMIPPMGLINSLNIFHAWFSQNQLRGMPESNIGWIVSTFAFLVTALGAQVGTYDPMEALGQKSVASKLELITMPTGPIFDAHETWKLVVPGSVGLVASMIFISFSTGKLRQSDVWKNQPHVDG